MYRPRARLRVEHLEDRTTPAASAFVNFSGDLVVNDNVAANLAITQVGSNSFQVTDNGNPVGAGTFNGVFRDVRIQTSAADDTVLIDLGGFSAPRNLIVNLGHGNNSLTVQSGGVLGSIGYNVIVGWGGWFYQNFGGGGGNDDIAVTGVTVSGRIGIWTGGGDNTVSPADGSVAGMVTVLTGAGQDSVTLGDGVTTFDVAGVTNFFDGGGPNDLLFVNDFVTIHNLTTSAVNSVTLAGTSTVHGSVYVAGGFNVANDLTIDGRVDAGVTYWGSGGVDTLTLSATASVGGGVNLYLGGGNDVVDLSGAIGGSLYLDAGFGDDQVTLSGSVGGNANLLLGSGNDSLDFTGSVGAAGGTTARLTVNGSYGNDTITIDAGSVVNGLLTVLGGYGDDSVSLNAFASFVTAVVDGGINATASPGDTFQGPQPRPGLTLRNFETFLP